MKTTPSISFKKTIISAILVISILAALLSCKEQNPPSPDTSVISANEAQPTESAAVTEPTPDPVEEEDDLPGVDVFQLVLNGKSAVRIVYPNDVQTYDAEYETASRIKIRLEKYVSSGNVIIRKDSSGGALNPDAVEIVVGKTSYEQGAKAIENLGAGSYMVRAFGNKIIVYAHAFSGYTAALNHIYSLFEEYLTGEGTSNTIAIPRSALKSNTVYHQALQALPSPDGLSLRCVYDTGEECEEAIFSGGTSAGFDAYVEKLKSSGYIFYVANYIASNRFATLYNKKNTLTVGYYDFSGEIRVVVEPFSRSTLIGTEEDNKFERICGQTANLVGLEYDDGDDFPATNGLSAFIRLTDGRFIVIDGGFNTELHARELIKALKSQMAERSSTPEPVIAAWILTHNHSDHTGLFTGRSYMFRDAGIKVERVILNFFDLAERIRSAKSNPGDFGFDESRECKNTYKAIELVGAERVVAHTGQVFHFADLRIEVLCTIDNLGPEPINCLNGSSLVMKMIFTDPNTGRETSYMSTGDCSGHEFRALLNTYGNYLKSDIVQVAHHGMNMYGDEEATREAYLIMAPTIVFWPVGTSSFYDGMQNNFYNKVLIGSKWNPNIKSIYHAGKIGKVNTFRIR